MGLSFFFLINYLNAQSHLFICLADLNCGMWDLGPCLGTELGPPALEARSLSHWTTTEVLTWGTKNHNFKQKQDPILHLYDPASHLFLTLALSDPVLVVFIYLYLPLTGLISLLTAFSFLVYP